MSALLKPVLGLPRILSLSKHSRILTSFWLQSNCWVEVLEKKILLYAENNLNQSFEVSLHLIKFLNPFLWKFSTLIIVFVRIRWNYFQSDFEVLSQSSKRDNFRNEIILFHGTFPFLSSYLRITAGSIGIVLTSQ